jgi:choline-glycine betaine transporter
MMHWDNGWDWYWMVPMMLAFVLVLGAVIYTAVRLGNRDAHRH